MVLSGVRLCSERRLLHESYRWHLTLGLQLLLVLFHSFVIHEIWLDVFQSSNIRLLAAETDSVQLWTPLLADVVECG